MEADPAIGAVDAGILEQVPVTVQFPLGFFEPVPDDRIHNALAERDCRTSGGRRTGSQDSFGHGLSPKDHQRPFSVPLVVAT